MRRIKSKTVGGCPCEYALRYIGGAWKILIVVILDRAKIRRHAELKRVLRGTTAKMLTPAAPGDGARWLDRAYGVCGNSAQSRNTNSRHLAKHSGPSSTRCGRGAHKPGKPTLTRS